MDKKKKERGKGIHSISFRSLFGIILLLLVFAFIVCLIGLNLFSNTVMNLYADGAFQTAEAGALLVNPDRIDEYSASEGKTAEYRGIWNKMDRLCNTSGVTFVYVILPDLSDYEHITFLFSTMNQNSSYTHYEFGYYRETTNEEYMEKYRLLMEGNSDREFVIRNKGYIETDSHITAMIPLKDSTRKPRAILCVQRQLDALAKIRRDYLIRIILVFVILTGIVIIIQAVYLHKMLLKPIQTITDEAARFAEENVREGTKLTEQIRNRDEIGKLAGAVDRMEEQVQEYVSNLTKATAEQERISTELGFAARIQADMLPSNYPAFPDRPEFDLHASMDPAKEVGGDFYDFFLIDSDHLCLVIADVSGKGVPAALFMMATMIILTNYTKMSVSPAKILEMTNKDICAHNKEDMFVTIWIGILEISTGKLTASNAGHEYPVLKKPDGCFELLKDKHGFVIGGFEDSVYKDYELQLEPGSKLFVYTDGVPEAMNGGREQFGTERMLEALNENPDASPQELLRNVRASVDRFVRDAEQFDDLTMLGLEIRRRP